MIIALVGEKGGGSKSTLLQNLVTIRALEKGSDDLITVDADVQATTNSWTQLRDECEIEPRIACLQKYGRSLQKELVGLAKKYETIFVDTGGRDSVETRGVMLVADMLLCPVAPSQPDLWAIDKFHALVETAKDFNEKLQVFVVLSRVSPNVMVAAETRDAREFLQEYEHFKVCESEIRERAIFRRAVAQGKGVVEMTPKDPKAINEIRLLYQEIFDE